MTRKALSLFVLLLAAGLSPAPACEVPVYRYALERWPADDYRLAVFHRGPLPEEAGRLLEEVADQAREDRADRLNVDVVSVDLDRDRDHPLAHLVKGPAAGDLPRAVLLYPGAACLTGSCAPGAGTDVAWAGPFEKGPIGGLLDSPARRRLAEHLLAGNAVTWVMIESGAREKDDAVAEALQAELRRHEAPADRPRMTFPLVRLGRDQPAEEALVRLFLNTEQDLAGFKDKTLVFPVFGRGRVLYALVGAGINPRTIAEACDYLAGDCSCEVKEENPGRDLLIRADWSRIADGARVTDELPPLTGLAPGPPDPPVAPVPGPVPPAGEVGPGSLARNLAVTLAGLALAVGAVSIIILRKRRDG
jgi:hypothetical protein